MTSPAEDKELFRREARQFAFRCECEDCAFYMAADRSCNHGYPTLAERRLTEASPLAEIFCKEFSVM